MQFTEFSASALQLSAYCKSKPLNKQEQKQVLLFHKFNQKKTTDLNLGDGELKKHKSFGISVLKCS